MKQLLCFCAAIFGVFLPSVASAAWKAGVAKVVITPSERTWLSGYGNRTAPAEGKVHDLYAKAAAFEDETGTRLVIVTLDLGSVNVNMTNDVARRAEKQFGLPRANLVLNCSHTHCAPEVAAERLVFHNLPSSEAAKLDRYIDETSGKLVELIGKAIGDLQPAELSVSKSSAGFAFNRRATDGIDENGVTDRDVPVVRISDSSGKLRGVLFGYACHNTTLNFQKYCGDYAGFAQADLEADHPGTVAMFVMGCGGDQNPQPRRGKKGTRDYDNQLEYAKQHGRSLADAVNRALTGTLQKLSGPLDVQCGTATLDLEQLPSVEHLRKDARSAPKTVEARKAAYLLDKIEHGVEVPLTQNCPLHVARFGKELLMIFISGETVVDYSVRCKSEFAGPMVWVAGYCDDVFAYLPSRRVLIEGGYEGRESIVHQTMATPFMPNVEDRVMGEIKRLVQAGERRLLN
jgi:neutral ceramidase